MKRVDMLRRYAKSTPVFDTKSVVRLIGDADYSYVLLNHLVRRGEIKRVTRGYYSIHNDHTVFIYCIKPAYIGLQDAMSFHNIWEQETNPVILTVRKVRPGIRNVLGGNVMVRRISRKYFFGFDYHKHGDMLIPVSDIEKTFIDMVYFRELRKDMLMSFKKRLDRERLLEYIKRYDKRMASRVLGIL